MIREGSAESGTWRRLTRAWISAVSIGVSSVTSEMACFPMLMLSIRVLSCAAGSGLTRTPPFVRRVDGLWKLMVRSLPVWLPARGMTASSGPSIANSPGLWARVRWA
jgi:hypothetical protein